MEHQPDWASPTWRVVFRSILHMDSSDTPKRHTSRRNHYLRFCSDNHVSPLPLGESCTICIIYTLAHESLQHRTIKTYLSGLTFFQSKAGLGDPFQSHMPRLDYVLKGVNHVNCVLANWKCYLCDCNFFVGLSPTISAQYLQRGSGVFSLGGWAFGLPWAVLGGGRGPLQRSSPQTHRRGVFGGWSRACPSLSPSIGRWPVNGSARPARR